MATTKNVEVLKLKYLLTKLQKAGKFTSERIIKNLTGKAVKCDNLSEIDATDANVKVICSAISKLKSKTIDAELMAFANTNKNMKPVKAVKEPTDKVVKAEKTAIKKRAESNTRSAEPPRYR